MCIPGLFGGPPQDNSAAIARQAEEARQARIRAGQGQIDQTFSQFDDDYYGNVSKASDAYYMPQAEKQYADARRQLVLNLSRQGTLAGSAGARSMGDLDESYATQRGDLVNRGVAAGNEQRSNVERARSELMSQLNASADPGAVGAAAAARAQSLSAPPIFSPLGKLFADFANMGANAIGAERMGFRGTGTGLFTPGSPSSGSGSFLNVRNG